MKFWALATYPQADGRFSTDWLVIGGGFAGLTAANVFWNCAAVIRLSCWKPPKLRQGLLAAILDLWIDLPHELGADGYAASQEVDRKQITLNRHAQAFVRSCFDQYEMPAEAVRSIGRINGAVNTRGEAHNADYARHLDTLGRFEALSSGDMKQITGSAYYKSGLFLPGAVMLQPALYIRSLADGIATKEKAPAQIFENSPAISFEQQKDVVACPHTFCPDSNEKHYPGGKWACRKFWVFQGPLDACIYLCLYDRAFER